MRRCARGRPGGSVLIVVISMGGVSMAFMDEVGMVTMLNGRMPAAGRMAMRMGLCDRVRDHQFIVVNRLREYGRRVAPPQKVGDRPAQHEDRDGQQDNERPRRRIYIK